MTTLHDGRIGTPITAAQAARAVLRMIRSPILGDVDKDSSPGSTLQRIHATRGDGNVVYHMLSGGERHLVDIAMSLWSPTSDLGAPLSAIGGLDKDNRRKVLQVLAYFHLGHDLSLLDLPADFKFLFEDRGGRSDGH